MPRIILHTVLLLLSLSLWAQPRNFIFSNITQEDGLASNEVFQVLKDHDGYLWIATGNGLQRYDGRKFISFHSSIADSSSLQNEQVRCILEDSSHRIWVANLGGVCYYDPVKRNFHRVAIDYPRTADFYFINKLKLDGGGRVLMTMVPGGLFFYDSAKNRFSKDPVLIPPGKWNVYHFSEDKDRENIFLGTDSGLVQFNKKEHQYYYKGHNPHHLAIFDNPFVGEIVHVLNIDQNNILWLCVWGGSLGPHFIRYDINANQVKEVGLKGSFGIYHFLTDAAGVTWATGESLRYYDAASNSFAEVPRSPNRNFGIDFYKINNISDDNEKNIWFCTDRGLYVMNYMQKPFTTERLFSYKDNRYLDVEINGFLNTRKGEFLALNWGNEGLYFFDRNGNQVPALFDYSLYRFRDVNYRMTWCGLQDSHGLIWIGCQAGRLYTIDPSASQIKTLQVAEFAGKTIRSMAEDSDGNIWFATHVNVIVKWIRSQNKFIQIIGPSEAGKKYGAFSRILCDSDHTVWASSNMGGLMHFDKDGRLLNQYLPTDGPGNHIASTTVNEIIMMPNDRLALATNSGIDIFDKKNGIFIHFTTLQGMPANQVLSMQMDDHGDLWFTSQKGISKLNLQSHLIVSYGIKDGITESGFYTGAAIHLKNDLIAFGNGRGFVRFYPDSVSEKQVPPDVRITGFSVFDKELSVDSLLRRGNIIYLSHQQNFFTIGFAAMSYMLNDKIDYYYQLEGIDNRWVSAGDNREAHYTHLPGGTYTFKVRCQTREGIACAQMTTMIIKIQPPFWNTWWFYLIVCLSLAGIIYLGHRVRINQLLATEKVRRRIARDLHDDMGSTLSTINILSEMAKMKIEKDTPKTREYISKISDNSSRMMEAMDDIVWSINPMNDTMQKITARMREFANGVLEAKNIEFDFRVDEGVKDLVLDMEARRDFFLVFKESINNTAKYSQCKHVRADINIVKGKLVMKIQDDGIGFDTANSDNGNGLSNMKKRAAALKGIFNIESQPGLGTQIRLEIPAG